MSAPASTLYDVKPVAGRSVPRSTVSIWRI